MGSTMLPAAETPAAASPGAQPGNQNARKGKNEVQEKSTPALRLSGSAAKRRIARLKRGHPEIAARMEAGEFKSVAAAERATRGEEPHPPRKKKPFPLILLRRGSTKQRRFA
jgi:hypothetical protein